jgi:hypothetical protein
VSGDDRIAAVINYLGSRIVLAALAAIAPLIAPAPSKAQQETPTDIVATQLRRQGFPCTAPQRAVPERKESSPNAAVWRVRCAEGVYRVTLVPNLPARVERMTDRQDEE